jgi:ribosomal protein L5
MKPRLKVHYEERVRPKLMEEFGYTNPYQVPRIEKIVVNVGVGEAPTIASTAAVAAAVRNATGADLTRVPIRPEHLVADLGAGG